MRGLVRLLVLCLILSASSAAWAQGGAAERRVALVIGNAAYKTGPLRNPVNDARDMAAALRATGFTVIDRYDANARDMRRAIVDFGNAIERDGVGLFFFAGHGVQVGGRNYLLPVDAEIEQEEHVEVEAIDEASVLQRMAGARSRLNIVILDACRNNPYASRFRSLSRGLAVTPAPVGTFLAYATGPGNVAADGSGRNGVFTAALLTAMKAPGVELEPLFKDVRSSVMQATGGRQVPWTNSSVTGDFYFRPAAATPVAPPQASVAAPTPPPPTVATPVAPPQAPVAAPTPPPPTVALEPIDKSNVVKEPQGARVREQPDVRSKQVATLKMGEAVHVLGKVKGEEWVLVERGGKTLGYMAQGLLQDAEEWRRQQAAVVPPAPPAAPLPARPTQPAVGVYPFQGPLTPGTTYRDCGECPEMVVVPAGSFTMGSPGDEPGRANDEVPQRVVTFARPFSVGKYEVTFEEWEACVAGGGCGGYRPGDSVWGRGRRPVINVSWNDAKSYVDWLNRRTGKVYRLLTEAEWEYVARGGTTTAWWCGSNASCVGEIGWYVSNSGGLTHEVGGKRPNGFGLHDVARNVWEWVEDCWHGSYAGAPMDGSAWVTGGNCGRRVLRGGSWNDNPGVVRAAYRVGSVTGGRSSYAGFRVARAN